MLLLSVAIPSSFAVSNITRGVNEDISYVADSTSKYHKLDLYLPVSDKPTPLVIFIHGGGWYEGDKSKPHAVFLVEQGFAVASINYRLVDEATWPAQIHDVKAAIRFLRKNAAQYNIDPNKIGVWGMSAGGHLAALAGASGDVPELEGNEGVQNVSSRVQAVVDWFGPTDFISIADGEPIARNAQGILTRFFGGVVSEKKLEAKAASPVAYASKDDPPFLLIHGDADKLVPLVQSQRMEAALKAQGAPCELIVVPGVGHQMFDRPYLEKVAEFFKKTLKS
jgi:acetyl esterase/lipase